MVFSISRQERKTNTEVVYEIGGYCIKKGTKVDYTLAGERLFYMLWQETEDGIMLTIPHKKLGDVHLLIMEKNGRFSWHIKDGRETKKEKKYPIGSHLPNDEFKKRYVGQIMKYVKKYNGNKKAWVTIPKFEKRLEEGLKKIGLTESKFPLEILNTYIECDFDNKEGWKRIRIKDMLKLGEKIGFIEDQNVIRMVIPINTTENYALFISYRQALDLEKKQTNLTGTNEYIEYILKDINRDLKKKAKDIIRKNKNK